MSPIFDLHKDKNLSVIVPFYKEAGRVKENIGMLEKELSQYFSNYEIIAVADNGKDETYQKILDLENVYPNLKVCEYGSNQGKGFALKYGFEKSRGAYVIFIDGDLNLHPKDIKVFLGLMDIYDIDIVIGSKRHPQSEIYYPLLRRVLSRGYQLLTRAFLDVNVKDTQVGLKLFKRQVLEDSLPRVLVKKYAFDLELLTVANRLGYKKILEAPIKLNYSNSAQDDKIFWLKDLIHISKVTWPMLVDTLAIIYRLRILKHYDKIPAKGFNHYSS
ncbi:glycosyltransferase [Candidatus Parcubacteria bacterium]|nr:glycosyltransferase [Candidatus Parcubacteria bacterium]